MNFKFSKLKEILKNDAFKNFTVLFLGSSFSGILPIVTSPLISRLYEPSYYGILGIFISITGLIGVVAYSHYSQAIMVAKSEDESKSVVWLSLSINLIISLLTLLGVLVYFIYLNKIEKTNMNYWFFAIPLSIFLNGITNIFMVWSNRLKSYKNLSFNRVMQSISTIFLQILIGFLIKNETGLMVGFLFGQFVSAGLLYYNFFIQKNRRDIGRFNFIEMKEVAIKYKDLVLFSTPSEFINNLINQMPVFLLQRFAGASYVGNFSFSQRFLGIPQQFLSSSIVDVFKQNSSEEYHKNGNCKVSFKKTGLLLVGISTIPFILFFIFAPHLFKLIFGEKWADAGDFARILSIMFYLKFVVSPLTYMYVLTNKLKEDFILHIMFLILIVISFVFTNHFFADKKYLLIGYAFIYSFVYLVYFVRSYKFSRHG